MTLNPMFQSEIKPNCLPWWCVVSQVGSAHLIGCSLIIMSSFLCVCVCFFFFSFFFATSLWYGVLWLLKLIVLGKDLVKKEYIFREREEAIFKCNSNRVLRFLQLFVNIIRLD